MGNASINMIGACSFGSSFMILRAAQKKLNEKEMKMLMFGLIALTLTGIPWSLTGVVMGSVPRRNLDASFVQFFGVVVSVLISVAVLLFLRPEWNCAMLPAMGCYFSAGFLNFLLLQLMSFAMQRGPNGIIWGIVQSGVLFPFLMGILFFSVPLPPIRAVGMVLLIFALFLFGKAKGGEKRWTKRMAVSGTCIIFAVRNSTMCCESALLFF